tara:strand:+ start:1829 stop:2692 length:864 start_codon:yes stop_codon:yes gene_type:complete
MRVHLCAFLLLTGAAQAQTAQEAFAERSLAVAVDDRCALLSTRERDTLTASWLQSRGTLLRSGYSAEDIRSTFEIIARRASTQSCESDAATGLVAGVRGAFDLFSRMPALDYPGSARMWSAQRRRGEIPVWTLSQTLADRPLPPRFGLYSDPTGEVLTLSLPDTASPASVVLVVRDIAKAPSPVDPTLGGLLAVSGRPAWARLAPPPHAEARFWINGRRQIDDRTFLEFPDTATAALAGLDPREAARIELYNSHGELIESFHVEVGDFAAGLAFLAAGAPPSGVAGR